jgi:3-isopropylmalate/(R)-2-methylmalate dehydratase large subunit
VSRCLVEKIWESHAVDVLPDGHTLLYVDRHLFHEGSFHAFNQLKSRGLAVRRPGQSIGFADHYVPTTGRTLADVATDEIRRPIEDLSRNAAAFGLVAFEMGDPRQGIVHVAGPELGITLPGMTVVCGDSHTTTHGALGALAFGIGASEVAHVLATQTLWQARPRTMRVMIDGNLPAYVTPKDVALVVLGTIGARGALGYAVEFAGSTVMAMEMAGRFTLCNMSVELGARAGLIGPDATTVEYLRGRRYAPRGADFDAAAAQWLALASDSDSVFDREIAVSASSMTPMTTWGTSPDMVAPFTGTVPDPASADDPARRQAMQAALDYMGLRPNMNVSDIAIDRVFIGSCTNARLEDLRAAAEMARRGKAVIPALVSPGSTAVQKAAESEGLHEIFTAAGFTWGYSGCSMCVGMNGDLLQEGERCASTTNRNFAGRQGKGGRTHLVSPALAAAAALEGRLVHPAAVGGR